MKNLTLFRLITVHLFAKAAFSATTSSSLPTVDLGYAIHQATVNVCHNLKHCKTLELIASRIQHTATTISATSDSAHHPLGAFASRHPSHLIASIEPSMMANRHRIVLKQIQVRLIPRESLTCTETSRLAINRRAIPRRDTRRNSSKRDLIREIQPLKHSTTRSPDLGRLSFPRCLCSTEDLRVLLWEGEPGQFPSGN